MKYRLIISDETIDQLRQFLDYIEFEQQAPIAASRWAKKVLVKLRSLKKFPHRCPFAPENEDRDYEIRMMIVDRCLFLYNVNEQDRVVRILTFRHGSQQPDPDRLPDQI